MFSTIALDAISRTHERGCRLRCCDGLVHWGTSFALVFGEFIQAESLRNVSRVLTFKLGANEQLPEPGWRPSVTFSPPKQTASAEVIAAGHRLYQDICMGCHGLNAVSGLLIPDLRGSAYLHGGAARDSVVQDGSLRGYAIEQAIRAQKLQASR